MFNLGLWVSSLAALFVYLKIDHYNNVKEIRKEELLVCNSKIKQIERDLNDKAEKRIEDAKKIEITIPELPADIDKLCQRSASCRDKRKR